MTWLGGWLHELILVVLLAAFVEMLLPSKSMERYARLVLSLLVLLTMLSPIVSLLKGDAGAELSLAMERQERSGGLLSGTGGGDHSLEQILADGKMLASGTREQSLKLAAAEVAGQMREQIAASTGIRGVNVTVALGMGPDTSTLSGEDVPVISAVTVALPEAEAAGGSADSAAGSAAAGSPIRITPVQPVQVSLDGGGTAGEASAEASAAGGSSASGTGSSSGGSAATDEQAAAGSEAEAIIRLLEQNWSLDPELIHIRSGSSAAVKS